LTILKTLHPFMPFVTEALFQQIPGYEGTPLIIASWPGIVSAEK
jgi:valyl-tRNA synthetase